MANIWWTLNYQRSKTNHKYFLILYDGCCCSSYKMSLYFNLPDYHEIMLKRFHAIEIMTYDATFVYFKKEKDVIVAIEYLESIITADILSNNDSVRR